MHQRYNIKNDLEAVAVFSDDLLYRYYLTREWSSDPYINFIMLNPSIGDEEKLEATTAGLMTRAKKWGYGGFTVTNLFGLISTDPNGLKKALDPVGPENDHAIIHMLAHARKNEEMIVCAWGRHGTLNKRDQAVLKMLEGEELYCLGVNLNGTPKHPLHIAHAITPERFM